MLVGLVVVVSVPIVVWWLVGDISEPGGSSQFLSIRSVDPNFERILGLVSLLSLMLACLTLWRACVGRIDPAWLRVLGGLIAAGTVLAVMGRLLTASTVGANIGGSMMYFVGTFLILYLVVGAFDRARRLWVERNS